MPPRKIAGKLAALFGRPIQARRTQFRETRRDARTWRRTPAIRRSCVSLSDLDVSGLDKEVLAWLRDRYLEHRFDLLGSGWVRNGRDAAPIGLEGLVFHMNMEVGEVDDEGRWLARTLAPPHVKKSRAVWKRIHLPAGRGRAAAPAPYAPIDWQKDCKSGWRFSAKRWRGAQPGTTRAGVDIKAPWELARMQHLPRLAVIAYALGKSDASKRGSPDRPASPDPLILEFRNQILDFVAANPPGMGCNWACAMEVGIRAANMLLAYDLFRQLDESGILDEPFRCILADAIYDHGLHIIHNLEWFETFTGNHYLADLCGLLYIAAYLEPTPEVDAWLAFAAGGLLTEFPRQFYEDGANFEASTSYHRLSGEIVVCAAALLLGLPRDKIEALLNYDARMIKARPGLDEAVKETLRGGGGETRSLFSTGFRERLLRAGMFSVHLTKPDGEAPQIGDNDSGRLFRLSPDGRFMTNRMAEEIYHNLEGYTDSGMNPDGRYWDENQLGHGPFVSSVGGLLRRDEFTPFCAAFPLEKSLVASLAGGERLQPPDRPSKPLVVRGGPGRPLPHRHETALRPRERMERPLTHGLEIFFYPDAGVYIFRSSRVHLTISAGPNGQNGLGGHAHNDKLGFHLYMDGENVAVDPGSYLYTPLPRRRNEFRSVHAHNGPVVENREPNRWKKGRKGLFRLEDRVTCRVIDADGAMIAIEARFDGVRQVRRFRIDEHEISIKDSCSHPFDANIGEPRIVSNGYGKLLKTKRRKGPRVPHPESR